MLVFAGVFADFWNEFRGFFWGRNEASLDANLRIGLRQSSAHEDKKTRIGQQKSPKKAACVSM